jgi:hypothetical protein
MRALGRRSGRQREREDIFLFAYPETVGER